MKNLLFIAFIILSINGFAQKKEEVYARVPFDSVKKEKPVYKPVRIIEENDYQIFLQVLSENRDLLMYNPKTDERYKVDRWRSVDAYGTDLFYRIKRDSVLTNPPKQDSVVVDKKKKK